MWRQRVVDLLGLRRSVVGMLVMVVLVGMGEHMAEQWLPRYMLVLGGGFLSAAALNALDNLLGALYSFPGGYLADRLGHKRALLLFNLIAMLGFAIVVLVPYWPAVLVASLFFLSWTAISLPATMGLVAEVLPKNKRTMGVSVHSLVRRIPMALGPLVGAGLIVWYGERDGVRLAFVCAFVLALVATIVQQWLIVDDRPAGAPRRRAESRPWRVLRGFPGSLRALLIADILVRFCEQIPYAFVVLWVVTPPAEQAAIPTIASPVTLTQFGLLRAIEMATALLIYIPVAYQVDLGTKKPFVVATFGFFTLFPLALWVAPSFWWLVPVFVLRGLKEFGEPARKALIMDLAPEDQKAATFGVYYLVRDTIVSIAAFAAGLLWIISPAANFVTAAAFGLAGTLWFAWRGRDLGPTSTTVAR
jgi:MFS family permease